MEQPALALVPPPAQSPAPRRSRMNRRSTRQLRDQIDRWAHFVTHHGTWFREPFPTEALRVLLQRGVPIYWGT